MGLVRQGNDAVRAVFGIADDVNEMVTKLVP